MYTPDTLFWHQSQHLTPSISASQPVNCTLEIQISVKMESNYKNSLPHKCIWKCLQNAGHLINSLGPSDAIWRQRSGSPLAQIMAWCLTAPSHYLNQCWLIISKAEWHSSKGKFTRYTSAINHWNCMDYKYLKYHSNFPGANVLRPQCFQGFTSQWHYELIFESCENFCGAIWAPSQYKDRLIYVWWFPC